jgi:hypothetical protein
MVYNTYSHWIFGLFPSSGVLENRKHDVSETGSVSVSSVMRFLTHRDLYDVTYYSWISIRFQSRVFRFYSTDGTSRRYYMFSHFFFHFFALLRMHSVLFVMFVAQISTSFSIPVPRMCVLYHKFLLYILLSPAELAWSQMIKQLCKSDRSFALIEINYF